MATYVDIEYAVSFGKGDGSEWLPYEIELSDEEEAMYDRAVKLRMDLNEIRELDAVLERATPEVEQAEMGNFIECGDSYVLECTGEEEVDPGCINDLVEERDPHTLEFFGLNDLTDEELEEWDANDHEMPLVRDFEEDFEPKNPFEQGYNLYMRYVNPDYDDEPLTDEEAREAFAILFKEANGDYDEVRDYLERCEYDYEGEQESLEELASAVAEEMGITDFEA